MGTIGKLIAIFKNENYRNDDLKKEGGEKIPKSLQKRKCNCVSAFGSAVDIFIISMIVYFALI